MITAIVDYQSGNLRSVAKSFERMARETGGGNVVVTGDPEAVAAADRVVLPGQGAFADCRAGLVASGLIEAVEEHVSAGKPYMGICVGMQLMAERGLEHGITPGFGWLKGEVVPLDDDGGRLKVPHMGWNELVLEGAHPVLDGVSQGDHAYFVHSFHFAVAREADRLAHVDYGGKVTAMVARDAMVGVQFHPEKSQATGLRIIANFLAWRP